MFSDLLNWYQFKRLLMRLTTAFTCHSLKLSYQFRKKRSKYEMYKT